MCRCAHDSCGEAATMRLRAFNDPAREWLNLCRAHYDFHVRAGAELANKRLGLDTVEKQREYVLQRYRTATIGKERVPGEDDE